jgi:hypothetical protein
MESGDGGWIRAEAVPPDEGLGEDFGLDGDDGWPEYGWPEYGWPEYGRPEYGRPEYGRPEYGRSAAAGEPATGPPAGKRWGRGGVPGFSAWVAAAVAVVAAAAGVATGLFLIRGTAPAGAVAGSAPSASAPAWPAQLQIALTGRVLAVSRTSITIGGEGTSVTAAVTGATTITGRAHGIGGVKAGDEVSARLTGTAARLTATTIQDLASA